METVQVEIVNVRYASPKNWCVLDKALEVIAEHRAKMIDDQDTKERQI